MASGLLSVVVVLALYVVQLPAVSARDNNCQASSYGSSKICSTGFCCGSCDYRYCCTNSFLRFTEDKQDDCGDNYHFDASPLPMILGIGGFVVILLIFICCCVCPCCCLYNMCRKPRPVIATSTHTTVVTTAPQQYPQQPAATARQPQSYQGGQYQPTYQPVPVQPVYGAQPMIQGYPAQPMPQGYGAQPMPTSAYHGQQFTAGPPPTYQEATGPGFPPGAMPYSQAAFGPGQPPYPMQPPVQPQPKGPVPHTDYSAQPAFNPDFTG
ncbi:protein shisa-5-like [Sebastes umbrosus]|uniref:protein shisa-5-like n=1 Tax=Sebastes umbrosus TaxID=72105 RepID=UPI0018A052FC|nr:protein shisa-5-like [Sebastes umbrosus]